MKDDYSWDVADPLIPILHNSMLPFLDYGVMLVAEVDSAF